MTYELDGDPDILLVFPISTTTIFAARLSGYRLMFIEFLQPVAIDLKNVVIIAWKFNFMVDNNERQHE